MDNSRKIFSLFKKKKDASNSVLSPPQVTIAPRPPTETLFSFISRDLWFPVICLLDPDSVVLLGNTCSVLYFITEDDSLWATFLKEKMETIKNTLPNNSWKAKWIYSKKFIFWKQIRKKISFVFSPYHPSRPAPPFLVKTVLLGAVGAGKTAMLRSLVRPSFVKDFLYPINPTTSAYSENFLLRSPYLPKIDSNHNLKIEMWDIGGQGDHKQYTTKSDVLIFVYDTNREETLQEIEKIYKKLPERKVPSLLVGTKIDLPMRQVTKETALKYAKERNMAYLEVSAKRPMNVDLPILFVAMATNPSYPHQLARLLNE